MALADNGRTTMFSAGNIPEATRIGIRLTPFGEDFYVVRAEAGHADLLGGIPAWRDRGASTPMRHGPVVVLSPADDGSGFKTLLSPDYAPWSLQEFSTPFRRRDSPEMDAMVVQLHMNVDAGDVSIATYLEESDAARVAVHRRNFVLDMRFNGGGNLQLTRAFLSALPGKLGPDGRIVVLTSPWTFSARREAAVDVGEGKELICHPERSYPPAIDPITRYGSIPVATASGSGASSEVCDRSSPHA